MPFRTRRNSSSACRSLTVCDTARAHCEATAADLRRAIEGRPQTGSIRFLHNLDWSIAEQVVAAVEELGGATQLIAAAPFWDDGAAIDGLCAALRLDSVLIHAHAHEAVEGRAGANWPAACRSAVQPVRLDVMTEADKPRRLHAKAFEILCRQGRIVVSGSANATGAALEADGNVEACVVRMQRERKTGWTFVPAEVPEPQPALGETDDDEDLQKCGVLRAVLDGDSLQGEVLTPAMTGALNVSYLSGAGEQALGAAALSPDRRFEISAPALEDLSFLGGRLVIRVLDEDDISTLSPGAPGCLEPDARAAADHDDRLPGQFRFALGGNRGGCAGHGSSGGWSGGRSPVAGGAGERQSRAILLTPGGFPVCILLTPGGFPVCILLTPGGFPVCILLTPAGFPVCILLTPAGFPVCILLTPAGFPVCASTGLAGCGMSMIGMRSAIRAGWRRAADVLCSPGAAPHDGLVVPAAIPDFLLAGSRAGGSP